MNFNTKTVSRIAGLSIRQIDHWDRTHFIKPSICKASGYGSTRLYSFDDLVQLRVAKTLLDKGVSLQRIRKAINYLKKNMSEVSKPLSELKFLTDGETIFVLTKNKRAIIDTLKSGQLVFFIALGEIVEELKGEVLAFQKEKRYEIEVKGRKFHVALHPDTGDSYRVECSSFPGCVSKGDTLEEALEIIKDTIEKYLQVFKEGKKMRKIP